MKTKTLAAVGAVLALSAVFTQASSLGTAFTYQGRLTDGGQSANGSYDLTFRLYDAASGGTLVAGALTNSPVSVTNGLFTVALDFGSSAFTGDARWLEIAVRTNGGSAFTALTPRQPLTAAPYALHAPSAGWAAGATTASGVAAGAVGSAGLQSGAVTSAKIATGAVMASNVNAATFGTTFWKTDGNSGTTGGTHFLGTTDNQPLELKVNNLRALSIEPTAGDANYSGTVNLVGGAPVNYIAPGAYGSVIGGGGATNYYGLACINSVSANFSFLGGGYNNAIQVNAERSFLGGGTDNSIQTNAYCSFLGGGTHNSIRTNVYYSFLGGGGANSIWTSASQCFLGGGEFNAILTSASQSFLGGGTGNSIWTNASECFLGGGYHNTIWANAYYSFVGGGFRNSIQTNACYSFLGGGYWNSISGQYGVVPGGDYNVAGTNSFAAGHRAKAHHQGSFVWGDSTDADFSTTADNQFLIRASGGVGINTVAPQAMLHVAGSGTNLVQIQNTTDTTVSVALSTQYRIWRVGQNRPPDSPGILDAFFIHDQSAGSTRFLINPAGNVGIGTNNPHSALHVAGAVQADQFIGSISGNAATATTATNFAGSLAGDVTGSQAATVVAIVGGETAANVASGASAANSATSANTSSTIVMRDASGNFAAGSLTLSGVLNLPTTTASAGIVYSGGNPLLHARSQNTFVGVYAGNLTMSGDYNTANGFYALNSETDGLWNTANGAHALNSNTSGDYNTADGGAALYYNTSGSCNTANGFYALFHNTNGVNNTANGYEALYYNTYGVNNTANGYKALCNNTYGANNTANGDDALYHNTSGSGNIALGDSAGFNLTTGDYNIEIGNYGVAGEARTIRIGTQGTQTNTFIAGIYGATAASGTAVYVNSSGQLGSLTSSRQFKEDIRAMADASEVLYALQPVTFRYKPELDPRGVPQFGLVAEDVDKVEPNLVLRDDQHGIYTVRYEAVNVMLLNEFLKEHRKVEEQHTQIEALQQRLERLEQTLSRITSK